MTNSDLTKRIYQRLLQEAKKPTSYTSWDELRRHYVDTSVKLARQLDSALTPEVKNFFMNREAYEGIETASGTVKKVAKKKLSNFVKPYLSYVKGVSGWTHGQTKGTPRFADIFSTYANGTFDYWSSKATSKSKQAGEPDSATIDKVEGQLDYMRTFLDDADKLNLELGEYISPTAPSAPIKGGEDPSEVLGQYAWAEERRGVPPEPDNETEKKLLRALINYLGESNIEMPPEDVAILQDLIARGRYRDILKAPAAAATIYRGTILSLKRMEEYLGRPMKDFKGTKADKDGWITVPVDVVIDPGTAKSWSTDKKVAKHFADMWRDPAPVPTYRVVLVAEAGENPASFLDVEKLYSIGKDLTYKKESEVLQLSPVKLSAIKFYQMARPAAKKKKS